jgi:hypothetical protein
LKILHQAVAAGTTAMDEARQDLASVDSRIRELALKLQTEEARGETLAALAAIQGTLKDAGKSGLSSTLDTLEKRYADLTQQNDSVTGPAPIVAWDHAAPSASVVASVEELLKTKTE